VYIAVCLNDPTYFVDFVDFVVVIIDVIGTLSNGNALILSQQMAHVKAQTLNILNMVLTRIHQK
jgi:hypothetical protein